MKVTFTFILSLPKHALIDMVAHQLSWIRLFLASLEILRSIIIYYIILRFFLQILNEDSVAGPLLHKFLVIPKAYNLRVTFFFSLTASDHVYADSQVARIQKVTIEINLFCKVWDGDQGCKYESYHFDLLHLMLCWIEKFQSQRTANPFEVLG